MRRKAKKLRSKTFFQFIITLHIFANKVETGQAAKEAKSILKNGNINDKY